MTPWSSSRVREVTWAEQRSALMHVRRRVFLEEQGIPEALEWDGLDPFALHWLAFDGDDRPIGTARLLNTGQIGRLAVLPEQRMQGHARSLLAAAIRAARDHALPNIWLNAQHDKARLYARMGFIVVSDLFLDAGIPHQRMVLATRPGAAEDRSTQRGHPTQAADPAAHPTRSWPQRPDRGIRPTRP